MGRYRKKPVEIDAVQWLGDWEALNDWLMSMGYEHWATATDDDLALWLDDADPTVLIIGTLEGDMRSPSGWWVIRGVQGEFYACKPDIFEATYEVVR